MLHIRLFTLLNLTAAAMPITDWTTEFPAAVTVCDSDGIILSMNDRAEQTFAADGGRKLVGSNVLDCHTEPSKSLLADMLRNPRVNAYTIEKNGVKKLIYQAPWYRDGRPAGIVELSLVLPAELPHHVRG